MRNRKIVHYSTLLALFVSLPAFADSSVWKISNGDSFLFLGGTIHFLAANDYPLPEAFEKAYQMSTRLVLETDLQKLQSQEFQQSAAARLTYANGQDLSHVLAADTISTLQNHLDSRGIPLQSIIKFKPGMVVTMLTVFELQQLGLAGTGVDLYFSQKAMKDNKPLGQLESVEQQLEFLASMGKGQEDELMLFALADIASLPALLSTTKDAWRNGDLKALEAVAYAPYQQNFADVFDALLEDRNNNWIPQIEAMLKSEEVEYILVGALHLVSDKGLLRLLSDLGYKIERL